MKEWCHRDIAWVTGNPWHFQEGLWDLNSSFLIFTLSSSFFVWNSKSLCDVLRYHLGSYEQRPMRCFLLSWKSNSVAKILYCLFSQQNVGLSSLLTAEYLIMSCKERKGWVWWSTPLTSVLKRQKQADQCGFKASQNFRVRPHLSQRQPPKKEWMNEWTKRCLYLVRLWSNKMHWLSQKIKCN